MHTGTAFDLAFIKNSRPTLASAKELAVLSAQEQHNMRKSVLELGSQGVGYLYGRHQIEAHSNKTFVAVKEWVNDKKTLDIVKYLTGMMDIELASA